MELPLNCSTMALLLFQILVFSSEVVYTFFPDADQVAKNLKASHFDCGAMTKNTLYTLNQVRQCHFTPQELEISPTKIILYTKLLRKKLNATEGRIQHQREKWHCGQNDHSSIDHTIAGITSDLVNHQNNANLLRRGKNAIWLIISWQLSTIQRILLYRLTVIVTETIATYADALRAIPSSFTCNERH